MVGRWSRFAHDADKAGCSACSTPSTSSTSVSTGYSVIRRRRPRGSREERLDLDRPGTIRLSVEWRIRRDVIADAERSHHATTDAQPIAGGIHVDGNVIAERRSTRQGGSSCGLRARWDSFPVVRDVGAGCRDSHRAHRATILVRRRWLPGHPSREASLTDDDVRTLRLTADSTRPPARRSAAIPLLLQDNPDSRCGDGWSAGSATGTGWSHNHETYSVLTACHPDYRLSPPVARQACVSTSRTRSSSPRRNRPTLDRRRPAFLTVQSGERLVGLAAPGSFCSRQRTDQAANCTLVGVAIGARVRSVTPRARAASAQHAGSIRYGRVNESRARHTP